MVERKKGNIYEVRISRLTKAFVTDRENNKTGFMGKTTFINNVSIRHGQT